MNNKVYRMKKMNVLVLAIGIFFASCGEDDFTLIADINCEVPGIVDQDQFGNDSSDEFDIVDVMLDGDCLEIEFRAGGCSGDTWELKFVGSEALDDSFPQQRSVRLILKDEEDCEAIISKIVSFDISDFKVLGGDVILNLEGYEDGILVEN